MNNFYIDLKKHYILISTRDINKCDYRGYYYYSSFHRRNANNI